MPFDQHGKSGLILICKEEIKQLFVSQVLVPLDSKQSRNCPSAGFVCPVAMTLILLRLTHPLLVPENGLWNMQIPRNTNRENATGSRLGQLTA